MDAGLDVVDCDSLTMLPTVDVSGLTASVDLRYPLMVRLCSPRFIGC